MYLLQIKSDDIVIEQCEYTYREEAENTADMLANVVSLTDWDVIVLDPKGEIIYRA